MTYQQKKELLDETMELIKAAAEERLISASPEWGPLHIVAVVAREAITLASSTREGRMAMLDVEG